MRKHKGFTLIELVVVVMILGILAAVAAPKLLNTSSKATDNGLRNTLNTIRNAIERHAADSGGQLPGTDEATFKAALADYLRGPFPICPVGGTNTVVVVSGSIPLTGGADANDPGGWKYSTTTGQFIVNSGEGLKSDPAVNYDEL